MKHLKKDMMVVQATCYRSRKPWGITIEKKGSECEFQWAFKISEEKIRHEGFDKNSFHGRVVFGPDYPGCPHCGAGGFYQCGGCRGIICMPDDIGSVATCPRCGYKAGFNEGGDFDLKGGGY